MSHSPALQAAARAREDQRRRDRRVECPRCHALAGQPCTTPSGRAASREHTARTAAARVDNIL